MSGASLFGWICILGGLWMMYRAFRTRARRLALLRDCVSTNGKIIRLEDTTAQDDTVSTQAPVVQYFTNDGRSFEYKMLPRHDTKDCQVGATIPIFYERGNPANAVHVKRAWDVNLVCALSMIPLLLGVGVLVTAQQDAADIRKKQ